VGLESQALNHGADEIVKAVGTNHVAARGTLAFPLTQIYFNGIGTRSITIIAVAQLTDERGNRMNVTSQVDAFARPGVRLPN
jgi:hypothetical protein